MTSVIRLSNSRSGMPRSHDQCRRGWMDRSRCNVVRFVVSVSAVQIGARRLVLNIPWPGIHLVSHALDTRARS
jgi:hypothetical protein